MKNKLNLESLEPRVLLSADTVAANEQLFVYLLNSARSDPQAYEIEAALSVSLAGISAQPPLALNTLLHDSAFFHADEMAANDYFAHQSAVTGDWPNKMAIDAGYILPFSANSNQIESIGGGFGPTNPETPAGMLKLLIEDVGVNPPGHRQHLLAMSSFWEQHREIGTGFASNSSATLRNYWSIHTAYVNTTDLFLTGVVYDDDNGNGVYDLNEGLANITVTTDQGGSVQTNSAGGWSMAVASGTYLVSASGGDYDGTGSSVAMVSDSNVEVDFTSGDVQGVVDFGLDTGSSLPKVSVAATDANGAEFGQETGTFTFTRTGDTTNAMTVNFAVSGSASSGDDYVAIADTIQIAAGQTEATIIITPVDDDDIEGQETVTLTLLASLEYQLGNTSVDTVDIADDEGAIVNFGDGGAKSVIYTDPDGTVGSISAKAATGTIIFTGNNIVTTTTSKGITVTADGGALVNHITLDNTSGATSLAFKAKGGADNKIDVEDITINGSAKDIKGKPVNLTGDLAVAGGLKKLEFADVADPHLITIGVPDIPGGTVSIKLANVTDLSINSGTAIKSLAVLNWQDTDQNDLITAPWLGKLASKQDFGASLLLTDNSVKNTLGGVKVTQTITQGNWAVTGNGGKISANAISQNWSALFTGTLAGLSTKQDAGGDLTALSVKSISVKGNYTNANVTLTQPIDPVNSKLLGLGKLTVKKKMDNVDVRGAGHLGKITIGQLFNSNIFAGVDASVTSLPDSMDDFDVKATIAAVKVKGIKTETVWLQNSLIAGSNVISTALGNAQLDNGDVKFGLATETFKKITYKDSNVRLKAAKPEDVASFPDLNDLIFRLVS